VGAKFILFNPGRNSEESAIKLIFFYRHTRQIGSHPSRPLAAMPLEIPATVSGICNAEVVLSLLSKLDLNIGRR
jgi:hypothetical protein